MIRTPGIGVTTMLALVLVLSFSLVACGGSGTPTLPPGPTAAAQEVAALEARVPLFRAQALRKAVGTHVLTTASSLTVADLRGVTLQANPPALTAAPFTSPTTMVDDLSGGPKPYAAPQLAPFRFRYFRNTFSYGGWHTWNMSEYASTHGYSDIYNYNSEPGDWAHLPPGTTIHQWRSLDWAQWMADRGYPSGRYDTLPDLPALIADVAAEQDPINTRDPTLYGTTMLNMEHAALDPETLRAQAWYPATGQQAFEDAYYRGFVNTHLSRVENALARGWEHVGIYGWQPFQRQWWGLESATSDPATYWPWVRFGAEIYDHVDVIHPSVYVFYWDPGNVAYVLANLDRNMELVRSKATRKPVRPYFWNQYHGGGGGWRWWRRQAVIDEEMRAWSCLAFFTGIDGLVHWSWSYTSNPHRVSVVADGDYVVDTAFAAPEVGMPAVLRDFERYDVLHVTGVVGDDVTFKLIDKSDPDGSLATGVEYTLPVSTLDAALRPATGGMDAMFEGLALVHQLEYLLRHGTVKIDVPAGLQFANRDPIVRRVKIENYHVIASFDPGWASHPAGRTVTLPDFDGVAGCTLEVPADRDVRVWILAEDP